MKLRFKRHEIFAGILFLLSLLAIAMSITIAQKPVNSEVAAEIMGKQLDRKVQTMDAFSKLALESDPGEWMDLGEVPEDLVLYRFVDDSLQCWKGEFPITNDRIDFKPLFPVMSNPQVNLVSPLIEVGTELQYMNIGPNWYLTRLYEDGRVKVISGLQIESGYYPMAADMSIKELSEPGGDPVLVGGKPVFRLCYEYSGASATRNVGMLWAGIVLLIISGFVFIRGRRSLKALACILIPLFLVMLWMFFWGKFFGSEFILFSPELYAGGDVFYSLGAILLINFAIFSTVLFTYECRLAIYRKVHGNRKAQLTLSAVSLLSAAGIVAYSYFAIRSLVFNSSIGFELYKIKELDSFSGIVYISFLTLLAMPKLCLDMVFGNRTRNQGVGAIYSVCMGAYLVMLTSVIGFAKEEGRLEVMANRLAVDRDITLELQLRSIESTIENDAILSTFSMVQNSDPVVQSRLGETYFMNISQDYDISSMVYDPETRDPSFEAFLADRMRTGTPISDGSNFIFSINSGGHAKYTGLFSYFDSRVGLRYLLINIEPKTARQERGYASILGYSNPDKPTIPQRYSYAKYKDNVLTIYKGSYPYPTRLSDEALADAGYVHFTFQVSPEDTIVISRISVNPGNYVTEVMAISLLMYFLILFTLIGHRRRKTEENAYYSRRITYVLMISLVTTLVVMAVTSVIFVYRRNTVNMNTVMSEKVTSLQALVESRCRYASSTQDLNTAEMTGVLEMVSDISHADITLYTLDGRAFRSTSPEFFEKAASGIRLDDDAYYNIVKKNKLYDIGEEYYQGGKFYSLYAPVFNDSGRMIAIMSSPYTEETYDFERDAVMHSVTVITLFLILLLVARVLVSNIVDRMFRPLTEMSHKMGAANVDDLELLTYDRDDEISGLVKAYNRMVKDLSESTRELARAERDNAWSGMARSVAHEINNSLSPMKLQLQRLVRLRQRGAEDWEEKFDKIAPVVLDQIDILSDTATQFLTFAKLYNENHVDIDIDTLLREQTTLFDGRDAVDLSYIGLEGAVISGPKPQLIRVIVNLITNSIQALGDEGGRVMVSLRNSVEDGYYDIVVEDDGPGVSEENQPKLFTPNFTTKNSGTGIGLAICKSILDMCGATISYSKSFVLGGAAFTIKYPKL